MVLQVVLRLAVRHLVVVVAVLLVVRSLGIPQGVRHPGLLLPGAHARCRSPRLPHGIQILAGVGIGDSLAAIGRSEALFI